MCNFICDGCGKEYPIEEIGSEVNNDNLAGIVMCESCMNSSKKYQVQEFKSITVLRPGMNLPKQPEGYYD